MLDNKQVKQNQQWLVKADDDIRGKSSLYSIGSDPTRLKILLLLDWHKELCVSDVANIVGISVSATSHQLSLLERGALVKKTKIGQTCCYSLVPSKLLKQLKNSYERR